MNGLLLGGMFYSRPGLTISLNLLERKKWHVALSFQK